MTKDHLKRLFAPKSWNIKRKKDVFITRPNPGPHPFSLGMSLNSMLRDQLRYGKTRKEVVSILNNKDVLVNSVRRKDPKFMVGFMDLLSLPDFKEHYRILLTKKGRLQPVKIDDKESKVKISRIIGKRNIRKKTQVNLSDSRNLLVDKDDYKVGDSLVIDLAKGTPAKHLKLEKSAFIFLTKGSHVGETGVIEDLKEGSVFFKSKDGQVFETGKDCVFVIGKQKPEISIPEEK